MWWNDFAQTAPPLAARLREEFDRAGVVLVGTIRRDGGARISPVEPVFYGDQLYLDMMRSLKAFDLLRDPRIEVHAPPVDRNAPQLKLRGSAIEVHDEDEQHRFAAVTLERLGWEPHPEHHLFRVDVRGATWLSYGEDAPAGYMRIRIWNPRGGYKERGPYPPPGVA
jgi:hypothetical protein